MRPIPENRLDRRIIRVWRISAVINVTIWSVLSLGIVGALWLAGTMQTDSGLTTAAPALTIAFIVLLVGAVLFAVLFVGIMPKLRHLRWRYQVNPEEIDILKGIIWRDAIIVPLVRVQNVDTKQGPLMRAKVWHRLPWPLLPENTRYRGLPLKRQMLYVIAWHIWQGWRKKMSDPKQGSSANLKDVPSGDLPGGRDNHQSDQIALITPTLDAEGRIATGRHRMEIAYIALASLRILAGLLFALIVSYGSISFAALSGSGQWSDSGNRSSHRACGPTNRIGCYQQHCLLINGSLGAYQH